MALTASGLSAILIHIFAEIRTLDTVRPAAPHHLPGPRHSSAATAPGGLAGLLVRRAKALSPPCARPACRGTAPYYELQAAAGAAWYHRMATQRFGALGAMFSYISLEGACRRHPLRKLRAVVDALLATMNHEFTRCYARRSRPSRLPPDAAQGPAAAILFSIRSERQLVEAVSYNLLYRWFVGLNIDDRSGTTLPSAPTASGSSMNLARAFFGASNTPPWASGQRRTLQCGRHADRGLGLAQKFQSAGTTTAPAEGAIPVDFKGQQRCNDTTPSTTDADARCSRRARATNLACATWGTSSQRTATG